MKKSIAFIGIILLLLLGTTVALAATEEFVVKANVENSRIYVGDKTKVGFTAIITDTGNSDMSIALDSYNFADNGVVIFNFDCFTVSYSSDNSRIAAVDDKGVVTGISAGSATITQKIAFNIMEYKAGPLIAEYYGDQINGCKQSGWDLISWQTNFASLIDRHSQDTFTREVTITVTPDDNLYLCQPGKEPAPVKMTMNTSSAEIDRLCVGAAINVDFSATLTVLNDPAAKYTFGKDGHGRLDPGNFTVSYTTDNKNVATVDSGGKVTGVSEGWANITVELKLRPDSLDRAVSNANKTGKAGLAVKPPDTARTVTFTRRVSILVHSAPVMNNLILAQSESRQLTVVTPPGFDKALLGSEQGSWLIRNPSIAKVDPKTGIVTGLKPGSTYAVYFLKTSGKSSIYVPLVSAVTVYPAMAIYPESRNVYIGTPETLQVTFDSRYSGDKTGIWSIADKSVASIDQSGKVTGIKAGKTTATFTVTATGAQTVCTVVVAEMPFKIAPDPLWIYRGDTEKLTVTFNSGYTGGETGTWSVADGTIVSVEDNSTAPIVINRMHTIPGTIGAKVTGLKPGTTIVTFTDTATGARRDCTVMVRPTFVIDPNPLTLREGEVGHFNVYYDDGVSGLKGASLGRWSVEDDTVALINNDGIVTGKKPGTTIVTYTLLPASPNNAGAGNWAPYGQWTSPSPSQDVQGVTSSSAQNGSRAASDITNAQAASTAPAYNYVRTASVVVTAPDCTVTFDAQNSSLLTMTVFVRPDTTVARPYDPSLRGMKFLGWYTALSGGSKWDFANDKVTEDITLYAHWGSEARPSSTSSHHGSAYAMPTITGSETIDLLTGYGSIDKAYTFGGYPAPTYGISPTEPNTANATFAGTTLTIPPGLGAGSYEVTLTASNSVGTATKTVTVTVSPAETTPTITGPDTISLLEGYDSIDQVYTFGGDPAPTYGISPTEPNTAGATFSGTMLTIPAELDSGSYEVTLFATNSAGTVTKTVTVHVYPVITINFVTEIEFFLSREDNRIDAFGGAGGPYTFTLSPGSSMPSGLTLNPDGTIIGTAATGVYPPVSVVICDCVGNSITTTMLAVRVSN